MAEATTPPNPADEGGNRPVPDPTVLTTDALRREIAGLEKLIDTKLDAQGELSNEKFRSVQHQLEEADKQRLEAKTDTKAAVEAALAAQKEAITKTEGSTSEQIAQLNRTLDTKVQGLERSHNDLKERVTILGSEMAGATLQREETRAVTAGTLALVGVGVTVVIIVINIVLFMIARGASVTVVP